MGKEIITFSNTEIEKQKFRFKNLALKDVDVDNLLISKKTSCGEGNKYFIRYLGILG